MSKRRGHETNGAEAQRLIEEGGSYSVWLLGEVRNDSIFHGGSAREEIQKGPKHA